MTTIDIFIDSNVWLYAFISGQDPEKTQKANAIIAPMQHIALSTQVVNEVCVNVLKRKDTTEVDIRDLIDDFYSLYHVIEVGQAQHVQASYLRERYSLSYWDSLIVATALVSGARQLFSEDMQDGLLIDNQLTIVNPFK